MIGKRPKAAPSAAESAAWPTGIPYTAIATTSATAREISPAHWAASLKPPSSTKRVMSGSTAKIADSPSELPTGSKTWLYIPAPPNARSGVWPDSVVRFPTSGSGKPKIGAPEGTREAVRVSLFITCFNDTLFPQAGRATVAVLERLGCTVDFPEEQTCCGQMHRNAGHAEEAAALCERFARVFAGSEC